MAYRLVLVGIGTPLLMLGMALLIVGVVSHQWPSFRTVLASPASASFWMIDAVLTGMLYGIGEEPGWRGFALPGLQRRWNALVATLLLFGLWAVFHTPFFFYRYPFALGSLIGFLVSLLAGTFWLTYLYNSTGGSVLITMVWHGLFNIASAIALLSGPTAAAVVSVLAILLAIVALVIGKPSQLSSARTRTRARTHAPLSSPKSPLPEPVPIGM